MEKEKVSVIIPIYNTAGYLNQCIQSVVGQTWENLEILLLDDGSTDGSVEICKNWAASDTRIKLFAEKHMGQGTQRNIGIQASKGDYIMFLDSDDFLCPSAVETIVRKIVSEHAQICFFSRGTLEEDGRVYSTRYYNDLLFTGCQNIESMPEILGYFSFLVWEKCYDGEFLRNCGIEMENLMCEDILFLAQIISKADKICTTDAEVYIHRLIRDGNFTEAIHRYHEVIYIVDKLNNYFMKLGFWEKYWKSLLRVSLSIYKDIAFRLRRNRMGVKRRDQDELIAEFERSLYKWYGKHADVTFSKNKVILAGGESITRIVDAICLEKPETMFDFTANSIVCAEKSIISRISETDYVICDLMGEFSKNELDIEYDVSVLGNAFETICDTAKKNGTKVVLIKQYLCENYGQYQNLLHPFLGELKIKKTNSQLESIYKELEKNRNEVLFLDVKDFEAWRFSGSKSILECSPFNCNRIYEENIAIHLGKIIYEAYGESCRYAINQAQKEPIPTEERFIKGFPILEYAFFKSHGSNKAYSFFMDNEVKAIAIYGYGTLGKMLKMELDWSGVKVAYAIDRLVENKSDEEIEIIGANEMIYPSVDLIVVTPVQDYWNIVGNIKCKTNTAIVSLEDIILYDRK